MSDLKGLGKVKIKITIIEILFPFILYAGVKEVTVPIKQAAKIDLSESRKVLIAPFIFPVEEGEEAVKEEIVKEFSIYIARLLKRETDIELKTAGDTIEYPVYSIEKLKHQKEFWIDLATSYKVRWILTGSVDFDVNEQVGYKQEEYISPFDGRVYTRQILVEETGFSLDFLILVIDGLSGEVVLEEHFKDFTSLEGRRLDPLKGLFKNLSKLEDKIVAIFKEFTVIDSRYLLY